VNDTALLDQDANVHAAAVVISLPSWIISGGVSSDTSARTMPADGSR